MPRPSVATPISGRITCPIARSWSCTPKSRLPAGNVTVYLEGLAVPIVLSVSSGESDTQTNTWTVDSRLDLRVPRRGPGAQPGAAPEVRIGLHDQVLQGFLDGVPPKEAKQLKTHRQRARHHGVANG
uniref:DotH/IcmK family type IV secretion protein n=1 Tax=Pseudomonas syringae TaxID=317 RepID=UPI0028BD667E|nr:DotH/IcmK family type IV secretion protein [Pseudomonas syringae]